MRIPKTNSVKDNLRDHSLEHPKFKKQNEKYRDTLRQVILQRQKTKEEENMISKHQDNESVRFQQDLLHKLENDQKFIMKTYVKDPLAKLNPKVKPNHAIAISQFDKNFNEYVHKKMKDREQNEETQFQIQQAIKKQRMQEIQEYNKLLMTEKKMKLKSLVDQEKMLSQSIIKHDLTHQKTFDSSEKMTKRQKTDMARKLLDEQIRADNELRNSLEGLESKEYALNANRIKHVIDKY